MKRIIGYTLLIALSVFAIVACKETNKDAQNTAAVGGKDSLKHIPFDSAVHPAAAANPQMKDGMNIVRWPNGTVKMQGNYKDGKRTGEWQSFYQNGKLNSDEYFVDGQTDGKVTVYYENGQKMYEGENHNGKLAGIWNYWDEKGKLTKTTDYSKQQTTKKP